MTGDKDKPTWFVSYALHDPDATHQRFARQTKTFVTEQQARAFAGSLLDQTNDISAGTLNPHSPRRVIAPKAIHEWVGDI